MHLEAEIESIHRFTWKPKWSVHEDTLGGQNQSGYEMYLEVVVLEAIDLKAVNLEALNLEPVDWEACVMEAKTLFMG